MRNPKSIIQPHKITVNDLTAASQQLDALAQAVLAYIEVTFMVRVQTTIADRLLLIPVMNSINDALVAAGYGPKLDEIYAKHRVTRNGHPSVDTNRLIARKRE